MLLANVALRRLRCWGAQHKLLHRTCSHTQASVGRRCEQADDIGKLAPETSEHVSKREHLDGLLSSGKQDISTGLYLVATPIGNLEDITLRALRVLSAADTVLAEDCRRTQILLSSYGIAAKLRSYHMHNEAQRSTEVLRLLQQGQVVALVSDAGTPGISDPGSMAVSAAIAAGYTVVPVPGPAAAVTALIASGLPTNEFHFVGFLPAKAGPRRQRLEDLRQNIGATMIFYVPPHGLLDILDDMITVLGGHRHCCVTRELTKMHEAFVRATLSEARLQFAQQGCRGEVTLCVAGSSPAEMQEKVSAEKGTAQDRIVELLAAGNTLPTVAKMVGSEFGMRKKEAYAMALAMNKTAENRIDDSDGRT